jgi:hypothetical protein
VQVDGAWARFHASVIGVHLDQPSRRRAAISARHSPALSHQTTQEGLASTPAPRSLVCLVSFRLISTSDRFLLSLHTAHCTHARTHCASIDPAAVELRLPALLLPASSTLATDTTIQHRVTIDLQPQLQSTAHLLACSSNTTTRTRTRPLPLLSAAVAGQQQQLDTRRDHSYISTRTPLQ